MPLSPQQSQQIQDIFNPIGDVGPLAFPNAASSVTGSGGVSAPVPLSTTPQTIFGSQPTGIVGASPSQPQSLIDSTLSHIGDTIGSVNPLTLLAPNPGTLGGNVVNAASSAYTEVSQLFLRGVVIILGFIFVAVGLSMFNSGKTVVETVTRAKK